MGPYLTDSSWVRRAFAVPASSLELLDQQNNAFSTASRKYVDTVIGGSFCINPHPQFTRFADVRPANRSRLKGSTGLGRYYSEAFDDNYQIIYMRACLPAFNSLTTFFAGFYNSDAGMLARTGRAPGIIYAISYVAGSIVQLLSWKLLAVHMLGYGFRLLQDKPQSKFYYGKPAMALYWNAVQTIVNQIAVNIGMVPRLWDNSDDGTGHNQGMLNGKVDFTKADIDRLHQMAPQIFHSSGSIDVYAMATRAQRLARREERRLRQLSDGSLNPNLDQSIASMLSEQIGASDAPGLGYLEYFQKWKDSEAAQPLGAAQASTDESIFQQVFSASAAQSATATESGGAANTPPNSSANTEDWSALTQDTSQMGKFWEFLKAEWDDGGAFASFRVEYTGTVSESFSNTVGESEIAEKMNSLSSDARSKRFNFAEGNLVGGAIGTMVGGVANAVKDFVQGGLDSIGVSGLAALAGNAFVDIPKYWQSSVAQLPRMNYTIQIQTPYGNPFSRLQLYIPMAMLLAMSLPLSTGRQSYTSPFLVEVFDKGRAQTRLGMIDSLTINRGTGNTGWTNQGEFLGVEMNFSIVDLSSVMHMPISAGFNWRTAVDTVKGAVAGAGGGAAIGGLPGAAAGAAFGAAAAAGVFDEDTVFSDYLNVLGGLGMADQIYTLQRFKRNLTQKLTAFDSWKSISHMASFFGEPNGFLPSRIASAFMRGSVRTY